MFGGPLTGAGSLTYSWQMDYTEGFGKHLAASLSWLNEGHIPGHHRDGQALQAWLRLPVDERRLVLALGAGPYRYFDTEAASGGAGYSDTHGWGILYSARATWYTSRRWTASLQLNHVQVTRGPSTTALMLGVGYQLDAPDTPGPRDFALPRTRNVTDNEITLMAGETILNKPGSPTSTAEAVEYRRGLAHWLDGTIGYLHEGGGVSARRDGATAQLWLTRAFLDERLTLGFGAGFYAMLHAGRTTAAGDGGGLAGLVSVSASYRFAKRWAVRATWNRVVTRYSRDTDVIVGGIGYRF